MVEQPIWTESLLKRRRKRALVVAWLLAGFVVLLIFVTIAKIGGNIIKRPPIGLSSVWQEEVIDGRI